MDFFAHGFWSYIIFHRIKKPIYAVMFGLMPDIVSWGLLFIVNLFNGRMRNGPPVVSMLPEWVFTMYGVGHSLIIAGLVILIVFLVLKKIPIYMFAWPIAILMDIVTHSREFLPTPFLWPISDWKFPGFSWGQLWFMALNYALIIGFLTWIIVKTYKVKVKKNDIVLKKKKK